MAPDNETKKQVTPHTPIPSFLPVKPVTPVSVEMGGQTIPLTAEGQTQIEEQANQLPVPVGNEDEEELIQEARTSMKELLIKARDPKLFAIATPKEIADLLSSVLKILVGLRREETTSETVKQTITEDGRKELERKISKTTQRPG